MSASGATGSTWALVVCTAVQTFLSWCIFIFPPVAVAVAAGFGLDPLLVGYQAGLVFGVHIIATLFSGVVVGRLGAVRALRLSVALGLAGVVACALPSLVAISVGSILFGISHSLLNPATAVILRPAVDGSRGGLVFSIKQASVPLGMALSSLVGTMIAAAVDWRWSLVPLALALAVLYVLAGTLPRMPARASAGHSLAWWRQPAVAVRAAWGKRPLLLCAFGCLSFGLTQNVLLSFASNMFTVDFDRPLEFAGRMLAWACAGAVLGRIGWGLLADLTRRPALVQVTIGTAIAVLGVMVAVVPGTAPWWGLLFFLLGATALGWNGLAMAELTRRCDPGMLETQLAGAFFVMFASGIVGPLLFIHGFALAGSYAAGIGLALVVFGLLAVTFSHLGRPAAPAAGSLDRDRA